MHKNSKNNETGMLCPKVKKMTGKGLNFD